MATDIQPDSAIWRPVRLSEVKEGDYVRLKDIHGVSAEGRISTKRLVRHSDGCREIRLLGPGQSFPTLYLVEADMEVRHFERKP